MRLVIAVGLLIGMVGCSDDRKSDFADGLLGPDVTVHCAARNLPGGIGDTKVDVQC